MRKDRQKLNNAMYRKSKRMKETELHNLAHKPGETPLYATTPMMAVFNTSQQSSS